MGILYPRALNRPPLDKGRLMGGTLECKRGDDLPTSDQHHSIPAESVRLSLGEKSNADESG